MKSKHGTCDAASIEAIAIIPEPERCNVYQQVASGQSDGPQYNGPESISGELLTQLTIKIHASRSLNFIPKACSLISI